MICTELRVYRFVFDLMPAKHRQMRARAGAASLNPAAVVIA
jgi:hypothetical protein